MEFKQWLTEAMMPRTPRTNTTQRPTKWKLSQDPSNRPGLINQGLSAWVSGGRNIKNELMWGKEPGGGPKRPSSYLPTIADIKKAYQDPNEPPPTDMPMSWQQAKQQGLAIASPVQTLPNMTGVDPTPVINQAFEAFLQSLPKQNTQYTSQIIQLLRAKGYTHFLNPPRPQIDATGTMTFEFVVPKPENIS